MAWIIGVEPPCGRYERLAADRDDLRSSATERNRFGRWSAITTELAAQRQIALLHVPAAAPR